MESSVNDSSGDAGSLQPTGPGRSVAAASATAGDVEVVASTARSEQTSNPIVGGVQAASEWLREADLDTLKAGIERQVREHPARSLAVAAGVGYLLGRVFRGRSD